MTKPVNHDTSNLWYGPSSPLSADGNGMKRANYNRPPHNTEIVPGAIVRYAGYPVGDENPPRRVAWVTERGAVGFEPIPTASRQFGRSWDLELVEEVA